MKNIYKILLLTTMLTGCVTSTEHGHEHVHSHGEGIEVMGDVPTVEVSVFEDPKAGFNVRIQTANFRFAPENASTAHVEGEGHAHLYVAHLKINRIYGEWYYFDAAGLEPGTYELRVDLNSNDHRPLTYNGSPIEDRVMITVE